MKRLTLLFATALLTIVVPSCIPVDNPEQGDPEENNKPADEKPDDDTLKPGTFKFVASELKGQWSAGDKIYVHGTLGSWAQEITLAAGDISADGKTATGYLDSVTEMPEAPDGLYAAWPAEAVKRINGKIGSKTSFASCEGPLTVAYLDADTFKFIDASSTLLFSVSGDFDNFALAANNRDGVIVTNFVVDYTSAKTTFTQKENSGYPFKYGSLESGKPVQIWMPGNMTFKGGITVYLAKGNSWKASATVSGDITLDPGKSRDLGDISASVKPYDGPEPKMPQMGSSKKMSVAFNELSGLCLSADQDFLWAVGDDGSVAKVSFEGEVLYEKWIGGDLEAISRNPENGDLVVGIEDEYNPAGTDTKVWDYSGVGRIPAPDFKKLEGLYEIPGAKGYNNAGIEGVTWYKDGLIYAGAQANSHLFCIKYQTGEVLWEKKMYDKNLVSEIADLCYDPLTDWLWIIDSEAKKVFVFTGDTSTLLGAYPIGGDNPESVCVDHKHSCVWVGDDYGSTSYLYRFEFTGLDDAIKQ